jgi:hypothetical protein
MRRNLLFLFALGLCTGAGCGDDDDDKPSGGSTSEKDGGIDGGEANDSQTAGSKGSAPAISDAPDSWKPLANCGGVGGLCDTLSCGARSMCQTVGKVCIPSVDKGKSLPGISAERPYCLAYTCMTYEEASCFCTGDAAKVKTICADGPKAVAGLCASRESSCLNTSCCDGLVCVPESTGKATCFEPCTNHEECATDCCTDLKDTGQTVCALKTECVDPCSKEGDICTQDQRCCQGVCVINTANPDFLGCRRACTSNEDCQTGCCQRFPDSEDGFCTDARYCRCGEAGAACGPNEPECCEEAVCSALGESEDLLCRAKCKVASDCPSGCCSLPFPNEEYGVCYDGCQS